MKNNITEIVFILDRSGSMGGLESDTIGGFNSMLRKQKKEEGEAFVSTVLFDHESVVLHDRLPIAQVPEMTDRDYTVRGCTALLDTIGDAKLIGKQKKHGWEFLFIGANIDAVETARCYGISEDRAVNYHADKKGTAVVFETVSAAVGSVRSSAPLAPCWSKEINDDYNSRKH